MVKRNDVYKVLLPKWIFETATDRNHLEKLVLNYMTKYPHYSVKEIKNHSAVCIRIFIPTKGAKKSGKV